MSSSNLQPISTAIITLPDISPDNDGILHEITTAIGVPREVIASDDNIRFAWQNLPRTLSKIPAEHRNTLMARMCVAIRTGLFDSAINYAWNMTIISLRNKLTEFGLPVASQLLERDLTDGKLTEILDSDLLKFCLELNLLSVDGYYFLNQCRDIRNNYSAAHPVIGEDTIDDNELINFISRCGKYAFDTSQDPRGIDIKSFLSILKTARLSTEQEDFWIDKIKETNDKQRDFILTTLHGIYCDEESLEETRLNCVNLCRKGKSEFSSKFHSNLINQHNDYQAKGKDGQLTASRQFFEKLEILNLLTERERHSIISSAVKRLMNAHQGWSNFHNEPPFAERLLELSSQQAIPDVTKNEFVEAVLTCATGNPYGISRMAYVDYVKIIKGFKQKEIQIMLELPRKQSILTDRIKTHPICRARFKKLVELLDQESIPASLRPQYEKLLKTL